MSKRTIWANSKNSIRTALLLLPIGAGLTATPALQAQPVSFFNAQSTILGTGLHYPTSVAVDGAGNFVIADDRNSRVLKLSPTGVQTTVGEGLNFPQGVATDAAGNIFIADTSNNRVLKVTTAGVQSIVLGGLNHPTGVAVDRANNLFIADADNNRILKFASGALSTVGSGLKQPSAVAADGAGNVFIADTGHNRVLKVSSTGGESTVTTSVDTPCGVAVDGTGSVYIADTYNSRVLRISPDGTQTTVANEVLYPQGVAVDQAGGIYIADTSDDRVVQVQLNAVNFGALNVCPPGQSSPAPCSRTLVLKYTVNTTGRLGTPAVLTQGASNLDFKMSPTNCTGVVIAGSSCRMIVTFSPLAPGARLGGIELTDNNGKVVATTMIYGQGKGPAIAFGPGVQTAVATGLNSPAGVALDGAGSIYVADFLGHRVLKVAPGGAQTEVGTGLRFPGGVAIDGAGDVLIADSGNNRVVKVKTHGGDLTVLATGLVLPQGIAVDGAGNIFIADYGNNRVIKIAASTGAQTTLTSFLKLPYGVAVDGNNNVFIADYGNDRVVKVLPNGAQTLVNVGGLNFPTSVAVDAAGDLFIGDSSNNRVLEVPGNGAPPIPLGTGLSHPQGVAVDATGNVFIADSSNNRLVQLQRSLPPSLSFDSTLVGKTSSPQTVAIQNIGNQPFNLVAPSPAVGTNFQQWQGGQDCTYRFTMLPSMSCNLSIVFAPQTAGNLKGTAMLTGNALNGAPSTQTLNLSGTGQFATTTTASAVTGQYSDSVILSAVIGPTGLNFAGTLQFLIAGAPACSVAVTGSGTYSCAYTVTQFPIRYSISANLASSDSLVQGSSGFNVLTVNPEDATITTNPLNPSTVTANSTGETGPFYLRGTLKQASGGSAGDFSKAAVSVKLVSGTTSISCPAGVAGGTITAICRLIPVGTYTVQWSTTNSSYFQAPSVNTSLTVSQ